MTGLAGKEVPPIKIDAAVLAPCTPPVDIPHRALGAGETATLWGQDRASLGDCVRKNQAKADVLAIAVATQ